MNLKDVYTYPRLKVASFLYELLRQREPCVNISHKVLPTFKNHLKFIKKVPYKQWFIIEIDGIMIGSIYLTNQDEIGMFLTDTNKGQGHGRKALKMLIDINYIVNVFYANISPENSNSICFFSNNGFKYDSRLEQDDKIIQYTYKYIRNENVLPVARYQSA